MGILIKNRECGNMQGPVKTKKMSKKEIRMRFGEVGEYAKSKGPLPLPTGNWRREAAQRKE